VHPDLIVTTLSCEASNTVADEGKKRRGGGEKRELSCIRFFLLYFPTLEKGRERGRK